MATTEKMMSGALSFLGWTFLPGLVTSWTQTIYYSLSIRAGDPKPQPGTPRHASHKRRIEIGVVLIYLSYNLYETHWEIARAGDFYALLGVSPTADDRTIQSRFRRLTLLHHPDKVPPTTPRAEAETHYIALQTARDTLLTPALRYAYDRFGPQALPWSTTSSASRKTIPDFVTYGLTQVVAPTYAASLLVLVSFGYLGMLSWGAYWRYLAFFAMGAFELRTVTGWQPPLPCVILPAAVRRGSEVLGWLGVPERVVGWLASYAPQPYLPFQVLQFAHSGVVAFFIALSRLGPLLEEAQKPPPKPGQVANPGGEDDEKGSKEAQIMRLAQRLEQVVVAGNVETSRQLMLDTVPFRDLEDENAGDDDKSAQQGAVDANTNHAVKTAGTGMGTGTGTGMDVLRGEIKDWMVKNTIRNDPLVSAAFARAVARRSGAGAVES